MPSDHLEERLDLIVQRQKAADHPQKSTMISDPQWKHFYRDDVSFLLNLWDKREFLTPNPAS